MTTRVYWQDPYLARSTARVVDVSPEGVVLDATVFHPRGGGQPGDTGTLAGEPVADTIKGAGETVVHVLETDTTAAIGDEVYVAVDWDRRYALMRHHSLLHVVHLAVLKTAGPVDPLGTSISVDRARIEYPLHDGLDVDAVEEVVAELVGAGLEADTSVGADGVRRWRVDGWDPIPCGGTHVRTLGEIGPVSLRVKSAGRRGIRLYAACDLPNRVS